MSYALHAIRKQMNLLEFDRSCGIISEGQYQREMAALRRRAVYQKKHATLRGSKPPNPHEEQRLFNILIGCVVAFNLLIPFTPVGEIREIFAIEPLPWFVAILIISLPLCYIPALLLTAWTRKR